METDAAIFYHPYTLHSRGALNAVSNRREFHGVLVRVQAGVGCLHPWPEFGDAPVTEQLRILRNGGTSKVIERALRMAAVDGEARRRGASLFEGLEIPLCHYSWDHNQPAAPQIRRVIEEGWRAIKTKGWGNIVEVLRWLEDFVDATGNAQIRVRVDFNSCLGQEAFARLLVEMPVRVKDRIDFVEDPFPYEAEAWSNMRQRHGVRLALDKHLSGASAGFDVAVLKPGRREWRETVAGLPDNVRVVMTSAMDHAIGQSFAAWEAAVAWKELGDRLDFCGLATEHLFAQDAFFARLSSRGGKLQVDRDGTGLGFDEVLANVEWRPL